MQAKQLPAGAAGASGGPGGRPARDAGQPGRLERDCGCHAAGGRRHANSQVSAAGRGAGCSGPVAVVLDACDLRPWQPSAPTSKPRGSGQGSGVLVTRSLPSCTRRPPSLLWQLCAMHFTSQNKFESLVGENIALQASPWWLFEHNSNWKKLLAAQVGACRQARVLFGNRVCGLLHGHGGGPATDAAAGRRVPLARGAACVFGGGAGLGGECARSNLFVVLCAYKQDVRQALRASSAAWLPCAMRRGLSPISMVPDYNAYARDALHAFSCYRAGLGLRCCSVVLIYVSA